MDTLVFIIHNPQKYPVVIEAIQRLKDNKGKVSIPDAPELIRAKSYSKAREAWFNAKYDSWHILQYHAKLELPSSAGGVNVTYDDQKQEMKFEFSVPKFLFGNNVCEILPLYGSKYYGVGKLAMWDYTLYWYKVIRGVIYKIIFDLTNGLFDAVDPCDIEVRRLDLTFNQIFDNEQDAKHYLEAVGRERLPRLKDGAWKLHQNGNVTYNPVNKHFYYKIYWKGGEFDEVQHKQIVDNFERAHREGTLFRSSNIGLSFEKAADLEKYADRILRYELECKKGLMSDLFNQHLKKKNIPAWRKLLGVLRYVMRPENLLLYIHLKVRYQDMAGKIWESKRGDSLDEYREIFYLPASVLDPADNGTGHVLVKVEDAKLLAKIAKIRGCYRWMRNRHGLNNLSKVKSVHKLLNKDFTQQHRFFLAVHGTDAHKAVERPANLDPEIVIDTDAMTLTEMSDMRQVFSPHLLKLLILRQNSMFKKLQFEKLPSLKNIELLAKKYNEKIDADYLNYGGKKGKKVNVNNMKKLQLVLKNMTWAEIRRSGMWHRSQVWRIAKDFSLVAGFDITVNFGVLSDLENVSRKPSVLYFRHYNEMLLPENVLSIFLQNTPVLLSF